MSSGYLEEMAKSSMVSKAVIELDWHRLDCEMPAHLCTGQCRADKWTTSENFEALRQIDNLLLIVWEDQRSGQIHACLLRTHQPPSQSRLIVVHECSTSEGLVLVHDA